MNHPPEVIIVGAGLVGMSLAIALAPYFKITLYEKHLPDNLAGNKRDNRPISLAYGSQQILQTLKIWPELAAHSSPIHEVIVSERGALGFVNFRAQNYALPALAYVVPLCELQDALYTIVLAQKNIALQKAPSVDVILQNKENLIVACDGSWSEIRDSLAIPAQLGEPKDEAHIFTLHLAQPHKNTAYERFSEFGTLALLPLPNQDQMQCVWTHAKNHAVDPLQIKKIFKHRVEINKIEFISTYPLQAISVNNPIHDNVILMGNAAHTLYPIAAQGFNLGLRDAAALAEVLVNANIAITDHRVLNEYLTWRAPDQAQIQRLTNSVVDIFDLQWPLLKPLRGLGMLALDLLPPLKRRFARKALGYAGKVPRLMRGLGLR